MDARSARPALSDGPLLLFAASAAAASLSLAYQAGISRTLGPAGFGAFASLTAVLAVAAVPVAAAHAATIQAAARDSQATALALVRRSVGVGTVLVVLGAAAGVPLDMLLGVGDPWACGLVGAWAGLAYSGASARGVLLGRQRWRAVACQLVASSATRLVLGVALTPALGLLGAMVATVIAETMATIAAIVPLREGELPGGPGRELHRGHGDVPHVLATQLGLWVAASLGVVLGRQVLDPREAGQLAASAMATGGALFIPVALAGAMFPRFAAGAGGPALRRTLAGAATLGVGLVAAFAVLGPDLVAAVAGQEFRPDRAVITGLACCIAGLGVSAVSAQYLLARRHPASMALWITSITVTALALLITPGPAALARLLAVAGVVSAIALTVVALRLDQRAVGSHAPGLAPPSLDLSIVLPSYNDGDRLRPVVDAAVGVVSRLGLDAEVIVVLDGSTDHSARTLAGLPASTVRVIELSSNQGKGAAVVHGFGASRGRLVGYLDGDGDLDPEVIEGLVDAIGEHRTWCAAGSKWDPTAQVTTTPGRRAMSAMYRAAVRQLFQLDVSDTQCGAKLFRRDALSELLPLARERRFALDLELLALGRRLDLGPVIEVPVRLCRPAGARSRISARSIARAAVDTVRLSARLAEAPLGRSQGTGERSALTATTGRRERGEQPQPDRSNRIASLMPVPLCWRGGAHHLTGAPGATPTLVKKV